MSQISYNLSDLFLPGSSPVENAEVLKILLENLIAIDLVHMKHHPKTPELRSRDFGVVYGLTNDWLSIPALYVRGFGDCKSLSAMRVAQLRNKGRVAKAVFRFRENPAGTGTDYHILVQTAINTFEDPSKELGMTDDEWSPLPY